MSLTSRTDAEIMGFVGERLRSLRKARRLSTVTVAEQTGLSRRTVYAAEHGENPTLRTLVRLLRLYGRLESLASFVPEPELSPMALLEHGGGRRRG